MLSTVDAVIGELGGTSAVSGLAGVGLSAVSNWKARGKVPPELFLIISESLAKLGKAADPALFSFREVPTDCLETHA